MRVINKNIDSFDKLRAFNDFYERFVLLSHLMAQNEGFNRLRFTLNIIKIRLTIFHGTYVQVIQ